MINISRGIDADKIFEGEDFTVYHRLYGAIDLTIITDKNTVGFYDCESKVKVETRKKEKEKKIIPYRQEG